MLSSLGFSFILPQEYRIQGIALGLLQLERIDREEAEVVKPVFPGMTVLKWRIPTWATLDSQ